MELKHQLNWDDWTQLYDTAKLLEMTLDHMVIMNHPNGIDPMDLEDLLTLCSRTTDRIIKMVQCMDEVRDPQPEPPAPDM